MWLPSSQKKVKRCLSYFSNYNANFRKVKSSLAHLPKHKKSELKLVAQTIHELSPAEMIILFGSYCTDNWVEYDSYEEDGTTYVYQSDFDVLVVVEKSRVAHNVNIWEKVNRHLRKHPGIKTSVSLIVHDIKFLNKKIARGEYFFTDIKKKGIYLYNSKNLKLARRRKLKPEEQQAKAQEDFEYWFEEATRRCEDFHFHFEKTYYRNAAFDLHQATEFFFSAILLVFTDYKAKDHNLERLYRHIINLHKPFITIFPRNTEEERKRFTLLNQAYIGGRYKKDYKITPEQLLWLSERIQKFQKLTQEACQEKIESFTKESQGN